MKIVPIHNGRRCEKSGLEAFIDGACTVFIALAIAYFGAHVLVAWWAGRFAEVAR